MGIGARDGGSSPRRPRPLSGRRWRKIRALVLARDGHRCATCGGWGNDVDHVRPRAMGGLSVPSNLRVLCATCNRSAGGRLGAQMRNHQEWPGAIRLEEE